MHERWPFVSVVIPTYNLARYTSEALTSVQAQTFTDFEVVIVDDGSTDDTIQIVQPFLSDSRFNLIQQENHGTAAARNTAVRHARGKWVAFLDCDDLWLPDKLEKQVALIEADPGASLVFGNGIEFAEDGDTGYFYRKREAFPDGVGLPRLLKGNCFWSCSVMVRREDIMNVGLLRTDVSGVDDYDLWLKVLGLGGVARGLWEPIARYRKRGDSQGRDKSTMYATLLRVYEAACDRLTDSAMKSIASAGAARVRSDLLLVKARQALCEGPEGTRACGKLLYSAWREYPERKKPLILFALSLVGCRRRVAKTLARKW